MAAKPDAAANTTAAASRDLARRRARRKAFNVARFCILAVYLIGVLAPVYWMLVTSLKFDREIVNVNHITLWPENLTFHNYLDLFSTLKFGTYLKNSALLSSVSAIFVVAVSILSGYGLARYRFRGKNQILLFFLITQMIPGVLVTIPLYIVYSSMRLTNTYIGLLIIYIISQIPFCVVTMRSFFERIPASLEEAARVDGCGRLRAIVLVVVPILFPGIMAVFVFAFSAVWNDLLTATIFTSSTAMRTIPVGMRTLVGKYNVQWGQLTAGGIVALIPTVVMFAFAQKYVVSGMTAGAVKE